MKRPFMSILRNNMVMYAGMGTVWLLMAILELAEPSDTIKYTQSILVMIAILLLAYVSISKQEQDDEMSKEHLGTALSFGFWVMCIICLIILLVTYLGGDIQIRFAIFLLLGAGPLSAGLLFYYQERSGE